MQIVIDYTQNVDVPEENRPLALGKVYIGEVDKDAKTNQVQAYIQQENSTPVPISQPITLSAGGTVSFNGSPARILCDSQLYSLRIDTKDDEQAYYISDNTKKAENIFFDAAKIGGTSKNLDDAFVEFSLGVQSDLDSLSSDINNVQNNVNSLDNQLQALLPAGSMIMFASSNPPAGWLVCNGVSLSTSAYPAMGVAAARA